MAETTERRVPMADPVADNAGLADALTDAAARVVTGGPYILGPEVDAFETAFARMTSTAGAVGVGSGTDALVLALLGAEVAPGDEVIAPAHTAGPTVAAIRMVGARPVLVDVDADSFNISPAAVERAMAPQVKAVIAVHLYGRPADVDVLSVICRRAGVALIEDCAQAAGATTGSRRVGSIGTAGCFSFYPTKNLGAIGDGGCVVSTDAGVVEHVRTLRTYGWTQPQYAALPRGRCSRLDEMQAAMLAVKLPHLDAWNARRREVAARYLDAFRDLDVGLPDCPPDDRHVYHLFVLRSTARDALEAHLKARGIGTGRHYPFPVHRQPGLADGARIPAPLTVTEQLAAEIVSLPIYYAITDAQVDRVIDAVRGFFAA